MALLLRFDGSMREVIPADPNRGFTAVEVADLMGCSKLERAELADGRIMLMDEESKCRNSYISVAMVALPRSIAKLEPSLAISSAGMS